MAETFWKFSTAFCKLDEVNRLSAALNIPHFSAGALVALLYAWGAGKADDTGNINDFTERAIESACLWNGSRGALVTAFHDVGILVGDLDTRSEENPLAIAAWNSVAGDLIKKRIDGRNRKRKQRDRERDGTQDVTTFVTRDATQEVTSPKNVEGRIQNAEVENVFSATTTSRPDFNTIEAYAANNLTTLSPGNMAEFATFKESISEDLIRHAIDEACAQGKRTWAYVRTILLRYEQDNVKTIGDAKSKAPIISNINFG